MTMAVYIDGNLESPAANDASNAASRQLKQANNSVGTILQAVRIALGLIQTSKVSPEGVKRVREARICLTFVERRRLWLKEQSLCYCQC